MSIAKVIESIKEDSIPIFMEKQTDVISKILLTKKIIFLDTCFISRSFHLSHQKIFNAFKKLAGGSTERDLVFVVTELVLYELKDSLHDKLQVRAKEFLQNLVDNGFCVVLLKEETVCAEIGKYLDYNVQKWNTYFATTLHDNIANLSKLASVVENDTTMPYQGIMKYGYKVPKDPKFIEKVIFHIKERKSTKDSLAEELICICLFFLLELLHDSNRNQFLFCSNDWPAIIRIRQAIQTSYPTNEKKFEVIHLFSLIQYMVNEKILENKDEVEEALKKIFGESVRIIVVSKIPFASKEEIVDIKEVTHMLFKNEEFLFIGKRKGE